VRPWPVLVAATERGICRLYFPPKKEVLDPLKKRYDCIEDPDHFRGLKKELEEYFSGKKRGFDQKVDFIEGTEFQRKVWNALLKIPYGETRSYQDIARTVGLPKGYRAVGMANRSNPVPLIVPCHRVIGKDGSMTGYGGPGKAGLRRKEFLLRLEGAIE